MKRFLAFFILSCLFFSCEEDSKLSFIESNRLYNDNAIIEINIPEAKGKSTLAKSINTTLENHIANALNFTEEDIDSTSLLYAIAEFDKEYITFKTDFKESSLVWEATFDGEVMYESPEVISIAVNSYTNTGGAHGNSVITFYNFNTTDGKLLELKDIISNKPAFTEIAKQHFTKELTLEASESVDDYFYGDSFHLPENIGFNDEGIILLYNTYEVASYAMGITEFTIPYSEIESLLLKH